MDFKKLQNKHEGEIVHVIGASKMMDNIQPAFFENRITVGANFAYKHFPCEYTVTRHWKVIKEWINDPPKSKLFHPEWTSDVGGFWLNEIGTYFDKRGERKELFRSRGIMGTAIDFARYIGAKEIVLWGVECSNEYMMGYAGMNDNDAMVEFNETNRNNIEFIIDYIKLKYGVKTTWM